MEREGKTSGPTAEHRTPEKEGAWPAGDTWLRSCAGPNLPWEIILHGYLPTCLDGLELEIECLRYFLFIMCVCTTCEHQCSIPTMGRHSDD